eukprot:scaffold755_cov83-Skeletonema_dohrnii-CCMP3373.AAC.1
MRKQLVARRKARFLLHFIQETLAWRCLLAPGCLAPSHPTLVYILEIAYKLIVGAGAKGVLLSLNTTVEVGSPLDTMVTRIVTRRIISSEERAAAVAKDSDRDDVNRRKDNKQSDDDDDKKHGSNEAGGGGGGAQKLCNFKSSQGKAAYRGICDVRSSYHDMFFNDDTADDGKAVDIQRDSSTTRKRPLLSDDVDDTEKKKHRKKGQKYIDLSDVPPKLPILSSRKGATSKYRGAYLHKATNKWRARIMIDGKQRHVGYYDTDKEAAVDYARARFKYNKV